MDFFNVRWNMAWTELLNTSTNNFYLDFTGILFLWLKN